MSVARPIFFRPWWLDLMALISPAQQLHRIRDVHRSDCLPRRKAQNAAVEVQLGLECALDVFSHAEAMLLTRERNIGRLQPLSLHSVEHGLTLTRRNHLVLESLE